MNTGDASLITSTFRQYHYIMLYHYIRWRGVSDWELVDSPSSFGNIFRLVVRLHPSAQSGEWKKFVAEVDSGSPVCVFNATDCELLGLALTTD